MEQGSGNNQRQRIVRVILLICLGVAIVWFKLEPSFPPLISILTTIAALLRT